MYLSQLARLDILFQTFPTGISDAPEELSTAFVDSSLSQSYSKSVHGSVVPEHTQILFFLL